MSSANILAEDNDRQFGRSFIYRRNSKGPQLEPCGMPHLTVFSFDLIHLAD